MRRSISGRSKLAIDCVINSPITRHWKRAAEEWSNDLPGGAGARLARIGQRGLTRRHGGLPAISATMKRYRRGGSAGERREKPTNAGPPAVSDTGRTRTQIRF